MKQTITLKKLVHEFRLELLVVGVLLLIALLFVVGASLGVPLGDLPGRMAAWMQQATQSLSGSLRTWMDRIGVMGLLALLLALVLLLFLVHRVRHHFRKSDLFRATVCPHCGARLNRVHRRRFDRVLSLTLLPAARRYQCANKDCLWSGLRRRSSHTVPVAPGDK